MKRLCAMVLLTIASSVSPAIADRPTIWTDIERTSPLRPITPPAIVVADRPTIWTDIERTSPLRPVTLPAAVVADRPTIWTDIERTAPLRPTEPMQRIARAREAPRDLLDGE